MSQNRRSSRMESVLRESFALDSLVNETEKDNTVSSGKGTKLDDPLCSPFSLKKKLERIISHSPAAKYSKLEKSAKMVQEPQKSTVALQQEIE